MILTLALDSHSTATAQEDRMLTEADKLQMAEKMEISLLTCAPGQEVYSLYGHTALKIDFPQGDYPVPGELSPFVANWGMFSFRKSFFVLRFVFGLTDYEMGIADEASFCEEYRRSGRSVIQQTLNLTATEKLAIWKAVAENYKPENREYRYNYFYDNCTTRARDIVTQNVDGTVVYKNQQSEYPSYRQLIHQMNTLYPWARFGNDMLLGVKADKQTTLTEQQFLPFNLKKDFAQAKIVDRSGKERPLVKSERLIVNADAQTQGSSFPLRPIACAWLLLAAVVIATAVEHKRGANWWLFDIGLLTAVGCAGVVLFLMIFSQHPTVSLNLQLLLLNPLPLVFMAHIVKRMRCNEADRRIWIIFIGLTLAFLVGGLVQDYAEGMTVVALALLIRYLRRQLASNYNGNTSNSCCATYRHCKA